MILIAHILIAILSLVQASLLFLLPSRVKLYSSYALVGLALASGTYLVASRPAHVMQACVTGLVYLGIVSLAIAAGRHRLAVAVSHD